MKIILSHDVDHLFLLEHWRDTFIPGLVRRSVAGLLRRNLNFFQLCKRFSLQLNNIQDLASFNAARGLPQTFFFAVSRGLNLSYDSDSARIFIEYLDGIGAEIGLHGMAYDSIEKMRDEREKFARLLGGRPWFVRNHYLRLAPETHSLMALLGYRIDSSSYGLSAPWFVDNMTVLPVSLMDVYLFREAKGDLGRMREIAMAKVNEACARKLPYFVINFHDLHFSDAYQTFFWWYQDFVDEVVESGFEFCGFSDIVMRS